VREGAPGNSDAPEDLLFSPRIIGHGSLSGCILIVGPEQQLIITQVRKNSGPRSAEWLSSFFQTVAAAVADE